MFAEIKLLNGYERTLTYKVPATWQLPTVGTLVKVPLQRRVEHGMITKLFDTLPMGTTFTIKEILEEETVPQDTQYHAFVSRVADYHALDVIMLYQRLRGYLDSQETESDVIVQPEQVAPIIKLTTEQQAVVDFMRVAHAYTPTLLHGVTGSGKTEVYKQLMLHAHAQHTSSMLLLPEVSLAVNFARLLRAQLPSTMAVYAFHSASPVAEKRALWQALLRAEPVVTVGVHMPVLLPVANLGLMIVDEEHEIGYQEKKHPRINTREVALMRAQQYNIPILLGSATPSISSLYAVARKKFHYFQLKERFAGAFPKIKLVKLKTEKKRREFWISAELEAAIAERISKKEQVIIFLNRRGHSFFVQCTSCSFIFSCDSCSVSLTYHDDESLQCHYCGKLHAAPAACTQCRATSLIKKGVGTQQVVTILQRLFPTARIGRADADSTKNKKRWSKTVADFSTGELDILVGTQTITKGYHFPRVTLVGIIWAELNLSIPFYNAAEHTLQQLIQVAGRAGRACAESEVIVQTFVEHPVFSYVDEMKYYDFYLYEMQYRTELSYPPARRFAEIEFRHADGKTVAAEAADCALKLQAEIVARNLPVTLLGPSKPPVHKIKNMHMMRISLKSADIGSCRYLYRLACSFGYASVVFYTPNPLS